VSLRDVTALIAELTGTEPELAFGPWRTGDQRWYVSDPRAFGRATGWRPRTSPRRGIAQLYRWLVEENAEVAQAV
jgi:CDP-paratose 2-epimerase